MEKENLKAILAAHAAWRADIRVECTNGIHFFMTYSEAQEY